MADSKQQQKFEPFIQQYTHPETAKHESFKVYRPQSKFCLAWSASLATKSATAAAILIATAMLSEVIFWSLRNVCEALGVSPTNDAPPADPFENTPVDGAADETPEKPSKPTKPAKPSKA